MPITDISSGARFSSHRSESAWNCIFSLEQDRLHLAMPLPSFAERLLPLLPAPRSAPLSPQHTWPQWATDPKTKWGNESSTAFRSHIGDKEWQQTPTVLPGESSASPAKLLWQTRISGVRQRIRTACTMSTVSEYLPAGARLPVLSNEFSAFSTKRSVFTESYMRVINLMFVSCTCKGAAFVREW